MNKLYFGDNLEILRDKIGAESIDLIYLDPPFQSGKDYNIIFRPANHKIEGATAQMMTFEDTWHWGDEAEREYQGLIAGTITEEKPNQKVIDLISSMRAYLGECSMMAYLCMMGPRLLEMKRVLNKAGSIYLHCDPTASHHLKLLMDAIFGVRNFRNEIVWCYKSRPVSKKYFCRKHDVILFYSKTDKYYFDWQANLRPLSPVTIKKYKYEDEIGKYRLVGRGIKGSPIQSAKDVDRKWEIERPDLVVRDYLKEGYPIEDYWLINIINQSAKERQGYPTQKPEALLEKIIKASSKEGAIVLDPFCGCGTTIAVAETLRRKWIGIDITYLAIDVIKKRLAKNGIEEGQRFIIDGEPTDVYSAGKLAQKDSTQFQLWCISKLDGTPSEKISGDEGVDGFINYLHFDRKGTAGKGIIQVKGTQAVNPAMVRDLKGTMKSQNAEFGMLITLVKPTRGMKTEAVKEGYYKYGRKQIPRIQLLTVDDLFKKPIPVILPANLLDPYKKPSIKNNSQQDLI